MKLLGTQANHLVVTAPSSSGLASRSSWLKSLGTLLGTGLLAAAPTAVFASPAAPAAEALPASNLVDGDEYIEMVKLLTGTTVPAVLGPTYGGNGRSTFALPNLCPEMAPIATTATRPLVGAAPLGQLCAIEVANARATTTSVVELRLAHLRQTLVRVA